MPAVDQLSALVARLEAVTAKLEATSGSGGASAAAAQQVREELGHVKRSLASKSALNDLSKLARVVENLETASQGQTEDLSAAVTAYDEILSSSFKQFTELSAKLGGDVAKLGAMVDAAFKAQRVFLATAAKSKQPSQQDMQMLLKPTSDKISEIQEFREKGRRSEHFNHLSAISESIPALGWVAVAPAPAPFVKEMNDAGQFYTNRVLKDFKEKSKVHVEWVKAWVQTLSTLQAYVKQHHTTGLVWNPKGGDAMSAGAAAPPPPPAGGPPLPPPPPPPGSLMADITVDQGKSDDDGRGALLDALNKGADITKGLKKVTADQMTHKNPSLRGDGVVKAKEKSPTPGTTKVVQQVTKPPKFELEGKKWIVEFHKGNNNLAIDRTEVNQSVYVYKCEGSTLKVGGKCNNIIVDSCKKLAVVFDSVLSSIEFINCQSVQMQVTGTVPTISIDKTDGCQMYLSKEALGVEIVTAKASEMNVAIPDGEDYVEQPIPEQFKTVLAGTKLVTQATEAV